MFSKKCISICGASTVAAATLFSACSAQAQLFGNAVGRSMGSTTVAPRPRVAPPAPTPSVPGLITEDPGTSLESRFQDWAPTDLGINARLQSNPASCMKSMATGTGFPADMSSPPFQAYWSSRAKLLQVESTPTIRSALDSFEAAGIGTSLLEGSLISVNSLLRGYEPKNRMENGINMRVQADKQIHAYNNSYYAPLVYFSALNQMSNSELVPALHAYTEARKVAVRAIAALYNEAAPGPAQLQRLQQINKTWQVMQNTCAVRSALVPAIGSIQQFGDPKLRKPPNYPTGEVEVLMQLAAALRQDTEVARYGELPFQTNSLAWLLLRVNGATSPKPFMANDGYVALNAALKRGEPALVQQIAKGPIELLQRIEAQRNEEVYQIVLSMPATEKAIQSRKETQTGLSSADVAPMSNAEKAKRNVAPTSKDLQALVNAKAMQGTASTGIAVRWIDSGSYGFTAGQTDGKAFVEILGEKCAPERGKHRCQFSVAHRIEYPTLFGTRVKPFEMDEFDIRVHWTATGLKSDDIDRYVVGFSYRGGGSSGSSATPYNSDKDREYSRERHEDEAKDREQRDAERQRQWQSQQDEFRERSRGRCKSGDICSF